MIFFCLKKPVAHTEGVPVAVETGPGNPVRNEAPLNVQFLSWNEVKCPDAITNLEELAQCVVRIAGNDEVCKEINRRAFTEYGLCLFKPEGVPSLNDANSVDITAIITRTFFEWAHPMIGNINNSPVVRPQVLKEQYTANWEKFTEKNMDSLTKENIARLLGLTRQGDPILPVPACKMADLTRSSHDQVRICPNMTTLARAITGEITTLATRRIEKLFALDLCTSQLLYKAQQALLEAMLTKFNADEADRLKTGFDVKGLANTEYIRYYFDGCIGIPLAEQWIFYIALIEKAVGKVGLPGLAHSADYDRCVGASPVRDWLLQWEKLPEVIRCGVILNSFRRFLREKYKDFLLEDAAKRHSVNYDKDTGYSYIVAAGKEFLPKFDVEALKLVWSWNRDEEHAATNTYRKNLLPLWGGPSGHAHGHLDFALSCLKVKTISVEGSSTEIAAVVLSSLFPIWRLYYDKRISAIHTIAETYEASIAAAMVRYDDKELQIKWGAKTPTVPTNPAALTGDFSDAFHLVLACVNQDEKVINPIRLMHTLKLKYYDPPAGGTPALKFEALKTALNQKRDSIAARYDIPLWTKPIVQNPAITAEALKAEVARQVEGDAALRLIKIFSLKNVKVYIKPPVSLRTLRRYTQAKAGNERIIAALYARLKQQETSVTLDKDTLASAEIPENWERVILTDSLHIKNAVLSPLEEGQFTVSGRFSFLSFGELAGCAHFSADSRDTLQIRVEFEETVKSFALAEQYKALPKTVNGAQVLSAVELKNLTSVTLTGTGLFFTAEMDMSANFWESARAIAVLEDRMSGCCQITATPVSARFSACGEVNSSFSITGGFSVGLHSLTLVSGLTAEDDTPPGFAFECKLGDFNTTLSMNVDSTIIRIEGEFDGHKVLTLAKIAELFALPGDISFLPADLSEAVFGSLGLLEIAIRLNVSPVRVESIDFVVSAEKPWTILSDKLTLQPFLCVSVLNPFDTDKRDVDLQIDGTWQFGSTTFITSVSPVSGYVSANMQEGQALDLSAAMERFMGGLTLPQISINGMRFYADYKGGAYEIFLSADKCLEFELSGISLGIRDVQFYLEYANRTLGKFKLEGTLFIGGIAFTVQGQYGSDSDWEFSASGMTGLEVNFSEILTKFTADIPVLAGFSQVVPSNFFSFKLGTIEASYKTQAGQFRLYLALEKIMITESFVIDSFLCEIIVGREKLERLNLRAAFSVVDVSLLLEVSKEQDGFKISGGTESGQKIAVGKMLSDFAGGVLGYPVILPEALNSFVITHIGFSYACGGTAAAFGFDCAAAFGGDNSVLRNIFSAETHISIDAIKTAAEWKYSFTIACEILLNQKQVLTGAYLYDTTKPENKNSVSLRYAARQKEDGITLSDVLEKIGMNVLEENCKFITDIILSEAELAFDFTLNRLSGFLKLSSGGTFEVLVTLGSPLKYRLVASLTTVVSLSDVPIVGGLTKEFLPSKDFFSVRDLTFYALSERDEKNNIPGGIRLSFTIFDGKQAWQIYEIKPAARTLSAQNGTAPKIMWMKLEKTIAIFTLHRIGLGLDGSYLMLVLDASLNVSPLTFSLYGAGIGVNISNFDLKFYITGFGVSFKNDTLSIAGEFKKNEKKYSGLILIQAKPVSVFAIAEYSEDGNLFAYAVLLGALGGPPAFFITGLALGFAYNKRLDMPSVDKIPQFPLVKGAMGKIEPKGLLEELDKVLHDEKGQKFLSAGIKFTSFEIIQSFVLLTVSFGNRFEIDLLGLSDVTVPPLCPESVTPLAHAQLALKATVNPSEGFFGMEARLTSESYILSKNCHLTGGFAFYLWFGEGEKENHKGDFVITLGGYHPKYAVHKPAHYPDVPPLGFNWNLDDHVKVSGGIYFALTPSTLMAGGRLAMTAEWGNLKAYFTAKADFFISWKPFHYDIEVGITLGGSYHVHLWLVSFTISLELGVNLHIWGPDFSATAHLSFWVVSFDISFGANAPQKAADLDWNGFCQSFLPKQPSAPKTTMRRGNALPEEAPAPISIAFGDGITGEITVDGRKMKAVHAGGVTLTAETVLPVHSAGLNGAGVALTPVDVSVKPMGKKSGLFLSEFAVTISDENGLCTNFTGTAVTRNVPSALWTAESCTGELIPAVPSGILLTSREAAVKTFPEKQFILLDDLYKKGTTEIRNAFRYLQPAEFPFYSSEKTIAVFSATVNSSAVSKAREEFLSSLGVRLTQEIVLKKYALEADRYFDEEVMIPV